MAGDEKEKPRLEIGHVLFMDIVGYSKLLIEEQSESLYELNRIVRGTEAVREAEANGKLIRLPTGDGMALVFTDSIESPVECALQINQALRAQPSLPLRMGIHSGPVQHVQDVNERANIAGAGINIAQRVMDCGDAGHILLSKRVADDLAHYRHWQPYLHDLGDCEVKHGVVVSMVNLYADVVGNPVPPTKFGGGRASRKRIAAGSRNNRSTVPWVIAAALLIAGVLGFAVPRWWAPIRQVAASPADSIRAADGKSPPPVPPLAMPEKSIAVLPFESFSADKDNAYFADAIQDEILTDLSKIADLKVISRTSVQAYHGHDAGNSREIGRALGVTHLLEGSVQRQGGKVRVTAQLIDTRSDSHLWAEHYDRDLQDIFAIQTEVAERIVTSLKPTLSPGEIAGLTAAPTSDVEAFDLYGRAKNLIDGFANSPDWRDTLLKAIGLLDAATGRDPNFALAYCLKARAHDDLYWFDLDHTPARLAQAQAAVAEALRLRPALGEAHLEQALLLYRTARDYPSALSELAVARAALPNNAQVLSVSSWIERRQGRWSEAVLSLERAVTLDPRNPAVVTDLTVLYDFLRRYADENRVAENAIQALPASASYFRLVQAQLQLETGQVEAARAILKNVPADYDPDGATTFTRVQIALAERKFDAAGAALAASRLNAFDGSTGMVLPRAWLEGLIARAAGQPGRANAALLVAFNTAQAQVDARPDDAFARGLLGEVEAALGRNEDAVRDGLRAVQLRPSSVDAVDGPEIETMLALIEAWTGNRSSALDRLSVLCQTPAGPHYGDLRLDPAWDVLKGDARFEKILAAMAPAPVP